MRSTYAKVILIQVAVLLGLWWLQHAFL